MAQTAKLSPHACFRCNERLYALSEPVEGWRYWCCFCKHFTSPVPELSAALAALPDEAIGVVAAVPHHLTLNVEVKPE